ncbi:hypothetical protein HMI54_008968 [Coelomomyces lativittatus]|nr:hypothetical protein HMI54_008968 [Coelomomyces lativittatus]
MISPSIPPPMNSAAPLSTLPSSETSSPPISSDVLFPLDNELKQLSQSMKPASASRIATITKLALKHVKHYKFIVHHIISFIKTCAPELKLSGLYMVDAICRASMTEFKKKGKAYFEKEPYVHRFETTLPTVTQDIQKKPEADGEKMKKLLSVWRQYYVFSNLFLDKAESTWYSNGVITPSSTNTTTNQPHDPSLSSSPTSSFGHPPNVTKATSASVAPWSLLPGDTTTTTPAPTFSFLPTTNLGTSTTSSTATTQMPLLGIFQFRLLHNIHIQKKKKKKKKQNSPNWFIF